MKKTVNSSQIDEYPKVCDVLGNSLQDLPRLHGGKNALSLRGELTLNQCFMGNDHILVLGINLDDFELHLAIQV